MPGGGGPGCRVSQGVGGGKMSQGTCILLGPVETQRGGTVCDAKK